MPGFYLIRSGSTLLAICALGCGTALADDAQGPAAALGGPGGPVMRGLVKQFDHNGDGQLDTSERQAAAADMIKRFDRNHNGRLDPDEQTAALVELGARRPSTTRAVQASLQSRLVERFDEDHDGQLDESERKLALKQLSHAAADRATNRLRIELLRRLDANDNGRLDRDELDGFVDPPADDTSGFQKNARNQQPDASTASDRGN
jgi:hypothetical protein